MHRGSIVLALLASASAVAVGSAFAAPVNRNLSLATTGPLAGGADSAGINCCTKISEDGSRVLFETDEPLVAADTDTDSDVYLRRAGTTTLLSTSAMAGGPDSAPTDLLEISRNGAAAYFQTAEPLLPADGDTHRDIYLVRGTGLVLLTQLGNAGGPDSAAVFFESLARNAPVVVFATSEPLVAADSDTHADVYTVTAGPGVPTLDLISTGADAGGIDSANAGSAGISDDGGNVYFATDESIEAGDGDIHDDLYRRTGTATTLISGGPMNGGGDSVGVGYFTFVDIRQGGTAKAFFTSEQLAADDNDMARDYYLGAGGEPVLISPSPGAANITVDPQFPTTGDTFFFTTAEILTGADADGNRDIYSRTGSGPPVLVSEGPLDGGLDSADVAFFGDVNPTATHVVFTTPEPLVSEDTDTHIDAYLRAGAETTLLSGGPLGGGADSASAFPAGISADGSSVLLVSSEPLTSDDTDAEFDLYQAVGPALRLVSGGPLAGGPDSANAGFNATTPDHRIVAIDTDEPLSAADTDIHEDGYLATVPRCFGRLATEVPQGTANLTGGPGPDVFVGNGATNIFRGEGGADRLCGGGGEDRLFGAAGGDRLRGDGGADRLNGGAAVDRLNGGNGADVGSGGAGADRLFGLIGADRLFGNAGNDRVFGNAGNDFLRGGTGRDLVRGGPGRDDERE